MLNFSFKHNMHIPPVDGLYGGSFHLLEIECILTYILDTVSFLGNTYREHQTQARLDIHHKYIKTVNTTLRKLIVTKYVTEAAVVVVQTRTCFPTQLGFHQHLTVLPMPKGLK